MGTQGHAGFAISTPKAPTEFQFPSHSSFDAPSLGTTPDRIQSGGRHATTAANFREGVVLLMLMEKEMDKQFENDMKAEIVMWNMCCMTFVCHNTIIHKVYCT